jgi:hypothetical protein
MPSHTRTWVALLAALVVLPATRAAQNCTQKFSDLKTCTLFNGQFASGSATSLAATMTIETQLVPAYERLTTEIRRSDECRDLYLLYSCIAAVSHKDFPAAAPCSSTGARLKQCKGLCVNFFKKCNTAAKTDAEIDKHCTEESAPAGNECFGDAGVLGMKAAPKSDAHTSMPPIVAVVFLALAACLAM